MARVPRSPLCAAPHARRFASSETAECTSRARKSRPVITICCTPLSGSFALINSVSRPS